MIKILYTLPNFDTAGSGRALLNLALRLDRSLFEVHIACKSSAGVFFETVRRSGIPVHVFGYEAPMRPVTTLLCESWRISRKLKQIAPDIIHSFHYSNTYGEVLPALFAGAKWVYTKKNMVWGGDGANAWRLRSGLAAGIVIQNSAMQKQFFTKSNKTTRIERGVDLSQFQPTLPNMALREQMSTPTVARVVIAVANLVPVKGIDILLEAFAQLATPYPDWHLWIIGDDTTTTGEAAHAFVANHHLTTRVHFSGKQSDVRAYLDHAEVFVLPTRKTGEGSPVALLEAMANAKVVLGANVPGIEDQLQHHKNYLFQPENVQALVVSLQKVLDHDTATNKAIGEAFHQHAAQHYSIEREVAQHQQFYQKILGK